MNIQQQFNLIGSEIGYWFVSANGRLWLPNGEVPVGCAKELGFTNQRAQPIGEWNGQTAWLICHDMKNAMSSIRSLLDSSDLSLFNMAGRAVQLSEFYRSHKYCGYCGHEMYISSTEWCCLCDHCKERYYPQISPSIIVAIRHQNKILLAKHVRHNKDNLYTVLAGFTEIGETMETAVEREVFEESKLKIKNVRYIGSQPWPFPNSLMMAYLADYDSGEIIVDKNELVEANWYHYTQLPKIPEYGTIARRLIEETIALCREYDELGQN
ncbi:NADH pyrophosphatase [Gilliamella sp. Choc5-1]|uniref:NAD(+) diphosphatase n=1 Tax=Gilliamella sp. Choc5-1 TaxID=3120238 RepID=UPI00080DE507|nr:NAD(+) diphosphatase [Gilliamella apicola]OCG50589.1 NADH pyrophosphatase [Gilliamella apicola]